MSFKPEHELHTRRFGRNVGLGLALLAFVGIVFGLTIVKVSKQGPIQLNVPVQGDLAAPEITN